MHGDAVGAGNVVSEDLGAPVRPAHTHPSVHHLGRVEVPPRVKGHVVGGDDIAALGTDCLQLAAMNVEGADLAPGHLGDVNPAIRAGAEPIGAEQPARWDKPLPAPPFGDLHGRGAPVTRDHILRRHSLVTRPAVPPEAGMGQPPRRR
jgi:hypothetical protein